jgi:hypothetical protein
VPESVVGATDKELEAPVGVPPDRNVGGENATLRSPAGPAAVGSDLPLVP